MANKTTNYGLTKPLSSEFYDVEVQNGNMDIIDAQIKALDGGSASAKTTLADADTIHLNDSAASNKLKKITWANVKAVLANVFAAKSHTHTKSQITDFPTSMTPSSHASTHKTGGADAISPSDIGAVPTSRTVNGKPLSENISIDKSDVGLGNVPNVSTNNQTPTYTQASALENIATGEKLSVSFGKIMKAIADLISHLANTTSHITAAERSTWNSKAAGTHNHTKSQITDFPSSMPASDVYAWAKAASKPNYTASEVGLGNVPNVATNNQTPTYTAASSPSALTSGEKLSAAFAKIAAAVNALISHLANTTSHITAAERSTWNSKAAGTHNHTKSQITDFPSSMPASDVYAWAKAASKPNYTASEVGAVSKAGDTMTGSLIIQADSTVVNLKNTKANRETHLFVGTSDGITYLRNYLDDNNRTALMLYKETTAEFLRLQKVSGGTAKYYDVFGEHNKPSGTYTGTNSTTTQTIDTGGNGDVILVQLTGSGGGMALVSKSGAICKKNSDNSVYALSADKAKFIGGVLTLATTDYALNRAYGYNWQVL